MKCADCKLSITVFAERYGDGRLRDFVLVDDEFMWSTGPQGYDCRAGMVDGSSIELERLGGEVQATKRARY